MRIVDDEGRLLETAKRAWDSGVVMDVGHGTGSFSFETAEAVMAAGRKPDVISTDLHQLSVNGPTFDLPTTLSKFIHLGMSLREVGRGGHRPSCRRARPRARGGDAPAGVARRRRAVQALRAATSRCRTSTATSGTRVELLRNTRDDRRRRRLERLPAAARGALDGGADLAARADPVHREAATAARARAHAGRDGGGGRRRRR